MINFTLSRFALATRLLYQAEHSVSLHEARAQDAIRAAQRKEDKESGLGFASAFAHLNPLPSPQISAEDIAEARAILEFLDPVCVKTEMEAALERMRRIRRGLESMTYEVYGHELRFLRETIEYEARRCFFNYYPRAKAERLQKSKEDWKRTLDKFPSTVTDLTGALDCYAGGNPTASVFHCMRVTPTLGLSMPRIKMQSSNPKVAKTFCGNSPCQGQNALRSLKIWIDTISTRPHCLAQTKH
jgi:hypothetical protein